MRTRRHLVVWLLVAAFAAVVFLAGCGEGGDDDDDDGSHAADDDDSGVDDDDDDDDDGLPLGIFDVNPSSGGASVGAQVTISGRGFGEGLVVLVGDYRALDVSVVSQSEALAVFPPVALTDCGPMDVAVRLGEQVAILDNGFEYLFDEDPIVFVHGFLVNVHEWDTMIDNFKAAGYPEDYLAAIEFTDAVGSNVVNARDELPDFVDLVLARTGAQKVDLIPHSMGAFSTRLYIQQYGGKDKVRDYVSLAGTHHGSNLACAVTWMGDGAKEECPAYAQQADSHNSVQWDLNGDPDVDDVDETPFGVEDGGGIYYNSLWTDQDELHAPKHTSCLNQKSRGDCSDPLNRQFTGLGHMDMVSDWEIFCITLDLVRAHNINKP